MRTGLHIHAELFAVLSQRFAEPSWTGYLLRGKNDGIGLVEAANPPRRAIIELAVRCTELHWPR
jgi:hypothetical protein